MEPYLRVMGSVGEPNGEPIGRSENDPYHSAVFDVVERSAFGAVCEVKGACEGLCGPQEHGS